MDGGRPPREAPVLAGPLHASFRCARSGRKPAARGRIAQVRRQRCRDGGTLGEAGNGVALGPSGAGPSAAAGRGVPGGSFRGGCCREPGLERLQCTGRNFVPPPGRAPRIQASSKAGRWQCAVRALFWLRPERLPRVWEGPVAAPELSWRRGSVRVHAGPALLGSGPRRGHTGACWGAGQCGPASVTLQSASSVVSGVWLVGGRRAPVRNPLPASPRRLYVQLQGLDVGEV